jgi:hypothetical protein
MTEEGPVDCHPMTVACGASATFLTACVERLVLIRSELLVRARADAKDYFAIRHLPLVTARIKALQDQRAALVSGTQ